VVPEHEQTLDTVGALARVHEGREDAEDLEFRTALIAVPDLDVLRPRGRWVP